MLCLDLYFEGLSGGFEPLHGGVVRFEPVHRVYNTGTRDPCQAGEARHQHWSPENWLAATAAAPLQTPAHIRQRQPRVTLHDIASSHATDNCSLARPGQWTLTGVFTLAWSRY